MATVTIPAFVSVELSYQVTKGYNFGLQFSINLGINYNGKLAKFKKSGDIIKRETNFMAVNFFLFSVSLSLYINISQK